MTNASEAADRLAATGVLPSGAPPDQTDTAVTDLLCREVATPIGHVLRVLAAECSTICRDRRRLCLNTLSDAQGRTAIDKLPPSPDSL